MEFTYIADGIDAVVIDNFYTEEQLKEIMIELKWLTKNSILKDERHLESAELSGKLQTHKHGIFLETVFANWEHSALISHGMTQLKTEEVHKNILGFNALFKTLYHCDARNHLLSYYENSGYYKSHKDHSFFTILNWFNIEPKQFEGGDMILTSFDGTKHANIEYRNNRVLILAGCTPHEVTEIKSKLENKFSGSGRYCNAAFLGLRAERHESSK